MIWISTIFKTFRLGVIVFILSYYLGIFLFLLSDLTNGTHSIEENLDEDGVSENFINYFGIDEMTSR